MKKGIARIGTSGYQYNHWRRVFYPKDVPKTRWFDYFASQFDTVELNTTFYHLPKADTFAHWRDRAPGHFLYTLKFSRYGSHLKRLLQAEDTVAAFYGRAKALEEFLGPILVQLPPRWPADPDRLADFLRVARAIAGDRQRWALEFRDARWLDEAVYDVLREWRVALCIHDIVKPHPRVVTADWVYLRYHGGDTWGNYPDEALAQAAAEVNAFLAQGLDVYAYFNNDAYGHAVANARELRRLVLGK